MARILQRTLAGRLGSEGGAIPLIAETGGQNAMVVDSSALVEQVVQDVLASAFDSAGQRCSALRVLCVQDDIAERLLSMLRGAMAELRVGNPGLLAVDIGPVIDAQARDGIERHISALQAQGCAVSRHARVTDNALSKGTFVLPTVIEIADLSALKREVFGPVLHVVRWQRDGLDALLAQINRTGYGLTMGVHTRIDETIAQVVDQARAGNVYVNRNIVGAVVGVQPFGGEGLSGTGPKAGGPLYMLRLLSQRPADGLRTALQSAPADRPNSVLQALEDWAHAQGLHTLVAYCRQLVQQLPAQTSRVLTSATGERNVYSVQPREAVLSVASDESDRLVQLAALMAVGNLAVWPATPATEVLRDRLPLEVQARIALAADCTHSGVALDLALHHGTRESLCALNAVLASRSGPIVSVRSVPSGSTQIPLEALVLERSLSINTAAAGGNASLMMLG